MNTFDALHRPPSPDGMGTGFTIALLVHAGLVAALAYGVAWRRQDVNTVSAELWAAVPQIAAPMAPPPPPPAPPAPAPRPVPAPPPPPPAPAQKADADIALKKAQKEKAEKDKAAREEAERKKERAEQEKADKLKADQARAAKAKADAAAKEKTEKAEKAEKAEKEKAEKAAQERLSKQRQENIARMNRELGNDNPAVGNNPGPSSGRAAVSAAPSATYAGRIRARVLPNIVYSGARDLSIVADVEVRVAPDGKIMSSKLVKSSGNPDWDREVLRALERTGVLPLDTDSRVPPVMLLSFDPTQR